MHIATQICNKRKWRVCKLEEEHNNNVYGTNYNRGERITIRYKDETGKYFDWAHLVGTLAHELAHNLIDDHSPAFYKLMNKIHDTMEKLDDYEKIYAEMTGSYYNRGFTVVHSREHKPQLSNGTSYSFSGSAQSGKGGNHMSANADWKVASESKGSLNRQYKKTSIESKEQRRRVMLGALQRRGLV